MTTAHIILHDRYPHLVPENFGFECADAGSNSLKTSSLSSTESSQAEARSSCDK
ncbi:hypothetical protein At12D13_50480 (plasmid) [Agrobacterium fabrum]|nr:hypothetical protein At12D13_50480 [Agrobacterium fabrum]